VEVQQSKNGADVEVADSLSSSLMADAATTQSQGSGLRGHRLAVPWASPIIEFCILHQYQLAAKRAKWKGAIFGLLSAVFDVAP